MKILRVFGVVVGIHVFLLMLIFANPGCSSAGKPAPSPGDTVAKSDSPPPVNVSGTSTGSGGNSSDSSPLTPAPVSTDASGSGVSFNPPSSSVVRFSPTRPGTTAAAAIEVQPVADVTPATPYTVVAGDNLTVVAKKFKVTILDLAAFNNLKPGAILRQGQKLIIPHKAPSPIVPASTTTASVASDATTATKTAKASSSDKVKHTVAQGETLGGIARKYGVTQAELGTENSITDPKKIRPGQVLTIPTPSKTKSKKPAGTPVATPPSHDAAVTPTPSAPPVENKTIFSNPPAGQQVAPSTAPTNNIPVIKVEDGPATTQPKS